MILLTLCSDAGANTPAEASSLLQIYQGMENDLQHSPFKRPLLLRSQETADLLSGDLYARLDLGLATLQPVAGNAERWCEIVLLLSNAKACGVLVDATSTRLQVRISSSKSADLAGASLTEFVLEAPPSVANGVVAKLGAASGPAGTKDILLQLHAIPLGPDHSFIHLHYSYTTQWLGRMAMQTYLQTLGRGKTGFTTVTESGTTRPIAGARGVIERNTMRYFLGLECALAHTHDAAANRFGNMAACWYDAVEQYPAQLHEMSRAEYLPMKTSQYRPPAAPPGGAQP